MNQWSSTVAIRATALIINVLHDHQANTMSSQDQKVDSTTNESSHSTDPSSVSEVAFTDHIDAIHHDHSKARKFLLHNAQVWQWSDDQTRGVIHNWVLINAGTATRSVMNRVPLFLQGLIFRR